MKHIETLDTKIKEIDVKNEEQSILIFKIQELAGKIESFKLLEDKINEKCKAFDHRLEKLLKMEQTFGEKENQIKTLNEKINSLENIAEKVKSLHEKVYNINNETDVSEMEQTFLNPSASIFHVVSVILKLN